MMLTIRNEAQIAARWWVDRLREGAKHDAGDAVINVFASFANQYIDQPAPEQVDAFESALRAVVNAQFNPEFPWVTLATDYGPDSLLGQAADAAGINDRLLPIKTIMNIKPGSVMVSYGYGAEFVEVMQAEHSTDHGGVDG